MSDPSPYGQPPTGEPYPYGQQPYGQQPQYGQPSGPGSDRRPGTVTAAAWITIVFSGIITLLFGFATLGFVVARDEVIAEMEKVPEFQDANIDADTAVGLMVAVLLGLVVWSVIAIVLAVFVLRRSNVARILLVISSSVTALFSLLSITSGVSLVLLIAAVAVNVLLFTGGAGDWFKRVPAHAGGYGGYPGDPYGTPPAGPYGTGTQYGGSYGDPSGQQWDQQPGQSQPPPPSPYGNPYGQQPGEQPGPDAGPQYPPPSENPYGQPPQDGGDHPPKDYPGR